jgi:predicted nuclease with TOPRIM domain
MGLQFEALRLLVSALFGAGLYHWVDKVKRRRTVKTALLEELRTNRALLEDSLNTIENQNEWTGRIGVTFQDDVYHTCRRTTPTLYLRLNDAPPPITNPYQKLIEMNKLQSALLGIASLDEQNREEAHDTLKRAKDEIITVIENLENESGLRPW